MKRFIVTILLAAFSTSLTLSPINVHAEISQKEASFGDTTVEKALDSSLLSGKNSCSFLLDISDGYDVITDENAVPEIEIIGDSGTALFAAAISPDRRKVCITGATSEVAFSPDTSISLRFYCPNDIERSSQQPYSAISSIIDLETQDEGLRGVNTVAIYGDTDGNGISNASDAVDIMIAVNSNGGKALLTRHLTQVPAKKNYFFPSALNALCPDCYQAASDGVINLITNDDAQEILTAAAYSGSGNNYNTRVGTVVEGLIDYSGNVPSSVTTVYEQMLYVPHVDNIIINGHGTCWLATIVSMYNYKNNANLTVTQAFNELQTHYNATPGGTTMWIQRANTYYKIWPHRIGDAGTFVDVYGQLNYDNPIFMGTSSHAVVLCGIKIKSDGSGEYKIMDSNSADYVTLTLNSSQMNFPSSNQIFVPSVNQAWANYYY